MVVVADDAGDVVSAIEHVAGRQQGNATGRAPVANSDERQAGQAEAADEVVRLRLAVRTAHRHVDVAPGQTGIGQRTAHRILGQVVILALESPEHRARGTNDVDVIAHARARKP